MLPPPLLLGSRHNARPAGETARRGAGVPTLWRSPASGRPGDIAEGDVHARGQAAVELALALPLVALLLLAVVQVGLIVRDQVLTVHAAREAARAAAVDPRPAPARAAALAGSGLEGGRVTVELRAGARVDVVVVYRAPTAVPLVGSLLPDLTLRAKCAMRSES